MAKWPRVASAGQPPTPCVQKYRAHVACVSVRDMPAAACVGVCLVGRWLCEARAQKGVDVLVCGYHCLHGGGDGIACVRVWSVWGPSCRSRCAHGGQCVSWPDLA